MIRRLLTAARRLPSDLRARVAYLLELERAYQQAITERDVARTGWRGCALSWSAIAARLEGERNEAHQAADERLAALEQEQAARRRDAATLVAQRDAALKRAEVAEERIQAAKALVLRELDPEALDPPRRDALWRALEGRKP